MSKRPRKRDKPALLVKVRQYQNAFKLVQSLIALPPGCGLMRILVGGEPKWIMTFTPHSDYYQESETAASYVVAESPSLWKTFEMGLEKLVKKESQGVNKRVESGSAGGEGGVGTDPVSGGEDGAKDAGGVDAVGDFG